MHADRDVESILAVVRTSAVGHFTHRHEAVASLAHTIQPMHGYEPTTLCRTGAFSGDGRARHQLMCVCVEEQFLAVPDAEFAEDSREVMPDSNEANVESQRDFLVRQAFADIVDDFSFARRETVNPSPSGVLLGQGSG